MSDPLRTDQSRANAAGSESDRTAKIEQLLLDGLDHYFIGQYEQAINVWTRALFLDRSHARARAYIERARAAVAERQRQSEELLHSGVAAFDRGESGEARRLLEDAIQLGAPAEEAMAVLARLDRMEPKGASGIPSLPPRQPPRITMADTPPAPRQDAARAWLAAALAALVAAGAAWLLAVAGMESVLPFGNAAPAELPPAPVSGITRDAPLPLRGELALHWARSLAGRGRLHDAIAALDGVRSTDPWRGEADRLKSELQRQLLQFAPSPATGSEVVRP
jgi:hypothetical protein